MKSRKFKKIISSVCLLLLAIIMIFSFPVSHVFAQSNTFAGTKIVITTFEKLSEEITEQWVTKDNAAENLVLPKELNATDENGQTILVEGIVWEHEKLNSENQDQEKYLFTAKLPEGYVLQFIESRELHVHAVFSGERIKNSHSLVLLTQNEKGPHFCGPFGI